MRPVLMTIIMLLLSSSVQSQSGLPPYIVRDSQGHYTSERDEAHLQLVPAGVYQIGDDRGRYDERPRVTVYLDAYLIDQREVSNRQFERFIKATGTRPQGPWRRGYDSRAADLPARYLSWNDAAAYARWVGRRLPSEAEWEAAAGPKRETTPRSPFGVLDLGRNVREWVSDWYDRYRYSSYSKNRPENPQGPADGTPPEERFLKSGNVAGNERSSRKVVRGGGKSSRPDDARKSRRDGHNPNQWYGDVGFRCAVSLNKEVTP